MLNRPKVSEEKRLIAIQSLVIKLEQRLREKGDHILSSSHEILGILEEEMIELKEAIITHTEKNIRDELLDIAVGAIFGVACIDNGEMDWL